MSRKRKHTTKKYIFSVIATLLILILIYLTVILIRSISIDKNLSLEGPYDVVRVIDGDTFVASINGEDIHVRLIGIDTPEVISEYNDEGTKEGELASEYTHTLLEGNAVYLEYDSELLDVYGRTLAYVYLPDRKTMVNELLLKNGYAKTMMVEPNIKYKERFAIEEEKANLSNTGFWSTGFFN